MCAFIHMQYAILAAMNGKFHGAKADINLWKPFLQKREEFSLAQIWINAGTHGTDLNTIEAGWQVLLYFCNFFFELLYL